MDCDHLQIPARKGLRRIKKLNRTKLKLMQKIILLSIAAFLHLTSHAQTNLKDSLKILLQKEKQDTSRVMLLAELSYAYVSDRPDTAMLLALEALSLSQRIRFVKGEAISLHRIGNAYVGNSPKRMEFMLQSLKLNEKINNLEGTAGNLNNIGTIYLEQEEYHQAIYYFLNAKNLHEQINNKLRLTTNLNNLGRSYLGLKQYDSAMVYIQQSYEIARKINYPRATGFAFFLMGEIYSKTGQKKLALEYYRLSIPYIKLAEISSDWTLSGIFLGMAKLFENDGQIDSTLYYAKQAFKFGRDIGSSGRVSDASSFLSSFYENRGNIDSAFFYLKVAKATNDSLFSKEKINQIHSLSFDEKLRQKEIIAEERKGKGERKHNLQFAAIAIGLITFIILFLVLSRSIMVKTKFIEFFGVLGLLAVFEFINLFIHPYLARVTNDSPALMLLVLIAIGALLIPLHHRLEKWITKVMVEKNKKIRLDAAKKTIANLEGKQIN